MEEGGDDRRRLFAQRRRLWQAGRAKVTPVREARALGRVRLVGRAIPDGAPLRAALTGRPAVFWEASVLRRRLSLLPASRREGPSSTPWNLVFVDAGITSFTLVDDAGGRMTVRAFDPSAVLAHVSPAAVSDHPRVNRDDPQLGAYLRARGVTPGPNMGTTGALHFLEACIAPDDRVTVYGSVRAVPRERESESEPRSYRDPLGETLALIGTEDDPIVLARGV
jgi:hypothetical protein